MIAEAMLIAQLLAVDTTPFLRGIYTSNATTYERLSRLGFKVMVGPHGDTELREADRLGLGIIPALRPETDQDRATIERLKSDTTIVAWYPFDEPDLYNAPVESVALSRARLKATDPTRPMYLTVFNPARYAEFMPYADIFSIVPYPIRSLKDRENVMENVYLQTMYAKTLCETRPLWVVLQCFVQTPWWPRAPKPRELHNMAYQAIAGGADGILWFIDSIGSQDGKLWQLSKHPALMKELAAINRELTVLEPILRGGSWSIPEGANTIENKTFVMIRAYGAKRYIIMANASREAKDVGFSFGVSTKRARKLFGSPEAEITLRRGFIGVKMGALGWLAAELE